MLHRKVRLLCRCNRIKTQAWHETNTTTEKTNATGNPQITTCPATSQTTVHQQETLPPPTYHTDAWIRLCNLLPLLANPTHDLNFQKLITTAYSCALFFTKELATHTCACPPVLGENHVSHRSLSPITSWFSGSNPSWKHCGFRQVAPSPRVRGHVAA